MKFMHLSMVCPRMGGGRGQPKGNLTFSGFQMSISPPLGLHFESNSHPWGELIGTHNSLYCSTRHLQGVLLCDKTMVPTNFVHFPKCRRHIPAGYLEWLFNTHSTLPKVPLNFSQSIYSNAKIMYNAGRT